MAERSGAGAEGHEPPSNRLKPIDPFYNVGLDKSQRLAEYWRHLGEEFVSPTLGEKGTEGVGVVEWRKRFALNEAD